MRRSKPLGRATAPRRRPVVRDWTEANAKVESEGGFCRVGAHDAGLGVPIDNPRDLPGCAGPVERAHVIGREHDDPHPTRAGVLIVRAESVVPLCRRHHAEYDGRRLDLLPYLDVAEQVHAVAQAGGLVAALYRVSGPRAGRVSSRP